MKKRILSLALAAIAGSALVGCIDTPDETSVSIDDVEITLTSTDDGVKLSWQNVSGVDFCVYKSKTRYGEYTLVEDKVDGNEYVDNSHYCYYRVVAKNGEGKTVRTFSDIGEEIELFGPNVYIFSPDDDVNKVKTELANTHARMVDAEFTSRRVSFLFKPGEYSDEVGVSVGYYTTVAGLGALPTDTSVRSLTCKNRALGDGSNALINFWRGAENLQVRTNTTWATSQGVSLRAVDIEGDLVLSDGSGYASGGLLADSRVRGQANSGAQQQWLSRNCEWSGWGGSVWNMCFSGVKNPPVGVYPNMAYTIEEASDIREKPFLTFDEENGYRIAIPTYRPYAIGCSWTDNNIRIEKYIEQDDIYFARSDRDSADTVNAAIADGKSVVFTPGIYSFDKSVEVDENNTVLLGMGLATITPTAGNACLTVGSCSGVTVAGLLFDAGAQKSDSLVYIGTADSITVDANLHDCFFRVGGVLERSAADTSLVIYGDGTTCDNLWIWRADHGPENNRSFGVGWDVNDGLTGAKIYGDNVTAYGLMAEHYKGHNVEWYGDNGKLFFYQSEIAYDVPKQSEWMDGTRKGYSSVMVDSSVNTFAASGLGIYANFHNSGIVLDSAITAPAKQGIDINHIATVRLNSIGAIMNAVNDFGGSVGVGETGTASHFTDKFIIE